ncbi:MAG TPA: AI-2E family transporter [Candidatus Udaeobacter sp.]|jgi:predicted PurR-regulated permease PerM|nr:AI-2E family transporter [Candidatus Udaeobacter sp.]
MAVKAPMDSARMLLLLAVAVVLAAVLWTLRGVVILVGFSLLLAYALDPIVSALERVPITRSRRLPRGVASALVVITLGVLAGIGLAVGIPRLIFELERFIAGAPRSLASLVQQVRDWAATRGLSATLAPLLDEVDRQGGGLVSGLGGSLGARFGAVLGGLGRSLEFALLPLLAFYLLAERPAVESSVMRFIPEAARDRVMLLTAAADRALRSYVRGQAVVVLTLGTLVGVALALLGFRLALLLGVLAGLGELIPYLGAAVVTLSIVLAGISGGPEHALAGLFAYIVINWSVGTFITPRVMGRHLKMHPFVVTMSVLSGVELLGPPGAMLALPAAALIQSLVAELAPPRDEAGDDRHATAAT